MRNLTILRLFLIPILFSLCSCIYDYPKGTGNNPSTVEAGIELSYDLTWDEWLHEIDFSTRARTERPHHFVFEIMTEGDGDIVCREEDWLSEEDFALGVLRHRFSTPLRPKAYDVAVWYERSADNFEMADMIDIDDFSNVRLKVFSHENALRFNCGFAYDWINLSKYSGELHASEVKKMTIGNAGARVALIATDVQQFLTEHHAEMLQGDSYSIEILTYEKSLNVYTGFSDNSDQNIKYTGDLFFPFGDYEELRIADTFIFCNFEDYLSMRLLVYNSARMIVTQSPEINIPLKRGFVTMVKGDLLTFPINGNLSIDHIWEGEFVIEV